MLYRNPEVPLPASLLSRTLRAIARFGANRRRRIAELDLLAMSGHLKRDLGLDTWTNVGR